jgi:hypothetical protein
MKLITEENKTDLEQERNVLIGKTVSLTLQRSTQARAWKRISVETQPQMRMPKQFGASLKVVLLNTIGSIVIHSETKIKVQKEKAQLRFCQPTTRFHSTLEVPLKERPMKTTNSQQLMLSSQEALNSLILRKELACFGKLASKETSQ